MYSLGEDFTNIAKLLIAQPIVRTRLVKSSPTVDHVTCVRPHGTREDIPIMDRCPYFIWCDSKYRSPMASWSYRCRHICTYSRKRVMYSLLQEDHAVGVRPLGTREDITYGPLGSSSNEHGLSMPSCCIPKLYEGKPWQIVVKFLFNFTVTTKYWLHNHDSREHVLLIEPWS